MRLTELDPRWIGDDAGRDGLQLEFVCPACAGKAEPYRHRLSIPIANPVDGGEPLPQSQYSQARWTRTGETFETLSLVPSIHHQAGRWVEAEQKTVMETHWHGYVTEGAVLTV